MAMNNSPISNHPLKKAIAFLNLVVITASMVVGITAITSTAPASATLATCAPGSSAQNSITVEPSHPTVMYIDSGMNPRVDAAYIGYRISNRTGSTMKGYWASFDNFTGGVVSLANPLDKYIDIPEIANNETKTVYVLVKATGSTRSVQAHDFKIFDEYPSAATAQNKYACNFAFAKVAETIKAAANKPTSTTVTGSLSTIGTTFQVTSTGATGTIGAGNPDVGRILWFTPAAYSTFPTRAFRLESVVLRVSDKSNLTSGNLRVYKERTFVKTSTNPDSDSTVSGELLTLDDLVGKRFYENVYTFRIIDAASTAIVPVAQISSGTQIKHSVIDSNGTVTINASSATIPATISKALESTNYASFPTATIGGTSYIEVPYKITLGTTSSTAINADKIVDVPASGGIYKVGSTKVSVGGATAVTYSDPETLTSESSLNPRPLHFFGPFTFSSTSNIVLTYKIYIPAVQGLYSNSATGFIGDRRIVSATTASIPAVKVTVGSGGTVTGSETTTVKLLPDPLTKPASSIDTSTATINGSINANDTTTAGYFEWGTSPTLSTKTTVSLGSITGSSVTSKTSSLTGLTPETTYYFRIIGIASGVRYEGAILSFTTLAVKAAPTVVTDAPTSVSLTNATLNATVDPNLTDVYVEFEVWYTGLASRVFVRMTDDPSIAYNNNSAQDSYNPYSVYAGSSPSALSLKMSDVGLSGMITNGRTIYYRARVIEVTGGAITTATDTKQFTFATYNDQVITFAPISDLTWGDSAPVINPTSDSGMTVTRSSLTPSVCTIDGSGNVVIVSAGICSLAANQPGGEKTAGVFYNPAVEVTETFVINTRAVTVQADNKSRYFGSSDPTLTFTRTAGTLAGSDTYTGTIERVAGNDVGTYQINQGNLSLGSNYSLTFISGTFTINPRPITITVAAKTKVYGSADPVLTYSLSESLTAGEGTSGSLTRAPGSAVGTYAITQGSLALSSNYSVTFSGETLTITAKPLVIRADSKTKASGGTTPTFTYTISGLVTPDSITAVDLTFPGPTTTPPTADGSYDITPSNPVFGTGLSTNYSITYETGTYTITNKTPQVLTWTAIPNKTYGETATAVATTSVNPGAGLLVTITSLTPSICTVPNPSASGATVTLLGVGTCQLRASQAGDSTYAPATSVDTSFEVSAKSLTITATVTSATRTYGDASATKGYTNTDLVVGDVISTVTLTFTSTPSGYTSTAVPTHAGSYTLTPSGLILSSGTAGNYSVTYVTTSYTINKKSLSITASSHSITEGDPVPNITPTYGAFAYSESAANLTGTQTCSTTYTITSSANTYPSSCSGLSSDDYTITYVSGSVVAATAAGGPYTVTYDLGGGSGTTPTETSKANGTTFQTAPNSGFSRSGYTFTGWLCNGVSYAASAPITMGSANLTCTAQWSANAPAGNSGNNSGGNSTPAKPVKKVGISSMITTATKPVSAPVQVVTNPNTQPQPVATPKPTPTPTPKPTATPTPTASPTPTPKPSATPDPTPAPTAEPSPSTTPEPEKTTPAEVKKTTFQGSGIAEVKVQGEEITVVAKKGYSGITIVKVTVEDDEVISQITANVTVLPLPPVNPVAKPVSEEKTRITWARSPNAIGYEVKQDGKLLCKTSATSCEVAFVVTKEPALEIISLGRDKTVSQPVKATITDPPAPVKIIPDVALVINFDTNKYNIDAKDRALIEGFAKDVVKYGYKEVDISGHTDSRGGVDNNVLSMNRAKASRDYLLSLVPTLKVTINGYADVINVASNNTAAGMAANRRAEFRVVKY